MKVVSSEVSYVVALNEACFFKTNPNPEDGYGVTEKIEEASRFSRLDVRFRFETARDIAKKLNGKVKKMTTKVVLEDVE